VAWLPEVLPCIDAIARRHAAIQPTLPAVGCRDVAQPGGRCQTARWNWT